LPREPMALFKWASQVSRSAALDLHRIGYFLPFAVVSKMPYLRRHACGKVRIHAHVK
jgi:hypothetical protein